MKNSAVEWLVQEINKLTGLTIAIDEPCVEQAKAMEKQVNAETWNNAIDAQLKDKWESFEQYYNEKFKQQI
jgi:hypothetical protein